MKREKIDSHLLMKAREAALYKVKTTLPEHSELPDAHVARCWMQSFIDVGLLEPSDYNQKVGLIKDSAVTMALTCSNDNTNASERLGMTCHPQAKNSGIFFGYMLAVKDILKILADK